MPNKQPKRKTNRNAERSKPAQKAGQNAAQKAAPKPARNSAGKADMDRAASLLIALRQHYPDAHCELVHSSPHELLIATILSAQTTDVAVNKVTPALFARFPNPEAFAASSPEEIEPYIRSIGLFRNKARAVHAAMSTIVTDYAGQVPRTMEALLTLRGVARKTANVVLGNAYNINDGVVVDTHVDRLAVRLGLVNAGTPIAAIERRLMELFPRESWCELSHLLIFHGRRACKARMAGCADHPICASFGQTCELRVLASKQRSESIRGSARVGPTSAPRQAEKSAAAPPYPKEAPRRQARPPAP